MPTFCTHCNNLVPDQPICPVCGKKLAVSDEEVLRAAMWELVREVFKWVFGLVGVGFVCVLLLQWLLG